MKKWQMALGILAVAAVALAVIFTNLKPAKSGAGNDTAAPAQTAGANQQKGGAPVSPQPGSAAPEFELKDLQGSTVKVSDLRGKKVVLNFWASWCGPCKMEMPDLVKKSEQYKDQIVFLGINLTVQESGEDAIRQFLASYNVKYQNVLDTKGTVADQYQILGIPTTITIDPNGKIVDRVNGMMREAQMETMFQKLLQL